MGFRKYLVTFALVVSAGCGGDDSKGPTCGMGTTLVDGMCVAGAGSGATCGSGTTLVNGVCVGDGGSTTTCGPGTVMQGDECVADTTAPGPVTGLAATASATAVDLSWTAGAGSTDTLVARLVAGAYDAPDPTATYTAGQTLPGGATVVAVGSATSATDTATVPGRYSYLVWSRAASGKYGFPRAVSAVVTVPAQTGTVVIDIANATATVMTQPANVTLAAANVVFDGTATVSFDLSATQNTAGHLFNVKAVFGAPSVGGIDNPSGNTATGDAFVTLGVGAIPPAVALTKSVAIGGVGPTDTVTLPITIQESGLAIVGANALDMDGGSAFEMQLPALRGNRNTSSVFTSGQFDASGRYFFGVTRWSPALYRLDTATSDVTATVPYPVGVGAGSCLVVGTDGYAYAVVGLFAHRSRTAPGFAIVKVDPVTMTTVATAALNPPSSDVVHGCALHGTTLAVGFGANVYLADVGEMTFIDVDATSPDVIDPIEATAGDPVQRLVFSPDGATLYASEQRSSTIYSVDPVAFTAASYHTAGDTVYGLTIDSAGVLWWGESAGVFSFDGTTETQVPNFTGEVDALGPRTGNALAVAERGSGTSFTIDVTDGTVTQQGQVNTNRLGHNYAAFPTP